jgi:hypothetical protein
VSADKFSVKQFNEGLKADYSPFIFFERFWYQATTKNPEI